MARPKNPRVRAVALMRSVKASAGNLVSLMESGTGRDVYIPGEDRTPEDIAANRWHRPRMPEEHSDADPRVWRATRERILAMSRELHRADILVRYQMATLGMDFRGVYVGRSEAMARLSEADLDVLHEELGVPR